jgi:hypothetical protein
MSSVAHVTSCVPKGPWRTQSCFGCVFACVFLRQIIHFDKTSYLSKEQPTMVEYISTSYCIFQDHLSMNHEVFLFGPTCCIHAF